MSMLLCLVRLGSPRSIYIYKWKPFTTNAVVVFLAVTGGSSL